MNRTLEITTIARCPLECSFCPQDKLKAAYSDPSKVLRFATFASFLSKIPPDVEIHFSGFVEPFYNPEVHNMIVLACAGPWPVHIYTTLMGLRPEHLPVLRCCQPAKVRIHVPDTHALVIDSATWIAQHKLYRSLPWRWTTYMRMGEMTGPVQAELTTVDGHQMTADERVELPQMLSRGGNLWLPPVPKANPLRCMAHRWHSNVMMPNGDVYGCCMDYALTVPLGNLFTEDYQAIHDRAETWRQSEKVNSICNRCEWASPL